MDERKYRQNAQAKALREIMLPLMAGENPTLSMSGTVGPDGTIRKTTDEKLEELVRRRLEQAGD